MLLLLCIALAGADPGHRPEPGEAVPVSRAPIPTDAPGGWREGEALVAVADGVVLRAVPDLEAPAVASLLGGALVHLQETPSDQRIDNLERPDRWLSVRSGDAAGWVREAGVTQAGWELDLDGDGGAESVTVGFNAGGEIVVRVRGAGGLQALNLGTRRDFSGLQDAAQVTVLPPTVAGIALVQVVWSAREQCGSGDHLAYASYVPGAAGGPPVLREALRHNGSGGDAPIWWETEARFEPASRTAVVHERNGESLDDGSDAVHHEAWRHHRLEHGVFVEVPAPAE